MKKDVDQLLAEWSEGAERAGEPANDLERQASRALFEKLRGLPPVGEEPSWSDFERSLRGTIDAETERRERSWWRRLLMPVAGLGLAAAAAVAVLCVHHGDTQAPLAVTPTVAPPPAPLPTPPAPVVHPDDDDDAPLALGAIGDVPADEIDEQMLDDVQAELAPDLDTDDDAVPGAPDGLVPDLSLDWVDDLDDAQLDKVDRWLAKAEGHAG